MNYIFSETIIILLGLFGFVLASYIHNKKINNKKLVCPLKSDCNTVINSDYSKIMGISVEVLGMAYYSFVGLAYGLYNLNFFPSYFSTILLSISLLATIFSFYLIFVQIFKIKQLCVWCIGSACICLLIFIFSFLNYFSF